ncbi:SDR family NAD(P)-dependent oxidoreductase [Undibacterium arcticum]
MFERTVDHYLRAPFALIQRAVPHLRQRGAGWILNIGSVTAEPPQRPFDDFARFGGATVYAAVKAAMHRFTEGVAAELQIDNIAVNLVGPSGAIRTPGAARYIPADYPTEPVEYLVETALALCHKPAAELTGEVTYSMAYPAAHNLIVLPTGRAHPARPVTRKTLMRAIVIHRFGGPEELQLAEVATPEPGAGEVLIRVVLAGVNPADWKCREGRLQHYFNYQFPFIVGFDAAGVVERVGESVTEYAVGDTVLTSSNQGRGEWGSYAEYVKSSTANVARLPKGIDFAQGATIPTAGATAWGAVHDVGAVKAGQKVLINGGSSSVGIFRHPARQGGRL